MKKLIPKIDINATTGLNQLKYRGLIKLNSIDEIGIVTYQNIERPGPTTKNIQFKIDDIRYQKQRGFDKIVNWYRDGAQNFIYELINPYGETEERWMLYQAQIINESFDISLDGDRIEMQVEFSEAELVYVK